MFYALYTIYILYLLSGVWLFRCLIIKGLSYPCWTYISECSIVREFNFSGWVVRCFNEDRYFKLKKNYYCWRNLKFASLFQYMYLKWDKLCSQYNWPSYSCTRADENGERLLSSMGAKKWTVKEITQR